MTYERLKRENVIRERNILQTLSEGQKNFSPFVMVYDYLNEATMHKPIALTLDMVLLYAFHVCQYVQLFIDIELLVLV